jgi:hypothetical protein
MDAVATKVCCVCKKDVSSAKRVKDAAGHYYCATCYEALAKRAGAAKGPPQSASLPADEGSVDVAALPPPHAAAPQKPTAPPADDGSFDLAEPDPVRAPKAAPRPAAAAPGAAPTAAKLPEVCPNCGARVFANRRLCIKCNRDVTQLGNIAELRAKREADNNEGAVKVAVWVGRIARVGIGLVVLVGLFLVGYVIYLQFAPISVYDHYPKTREAAARDFLKAVSDGTDKSYEKAYLLVSFRERGFDSSETGKYTAVFKRMHAEFAQKYGADWLSKVKLENTGVNTSYQDDEVDFKLTLGADTYTVATQVQIDETTAVSNMVMPRKSKPVYNENDKNRFGILDVSGYTFGQQRRMAERYGNSQPSSPEDLLPGGGMIQKP